MRKQHPIGKRLRQARIRNNLGTRAMAQALGCSRPNIQRIELRGYRPTDDTIKRYADYLGESATYLRTGRYK